MNFCLFRGVRRGERRLPEDRALAQAVFCALPRAETQLEEFGHIVEFYRMDGAAFGEIFLAP